MASIASLDIALGIRTDRLSRDQKRARRELQNFQRGATDSLRRVGLAATAATAAFAAMARQSITAADEIAKSARNAGLSRESYQGLAIAFELGGSNAQSLVKASQALSRQIVQAQQGSLQATRAFRALGVSQADLAENSPEENLRAVIRGLQGIQHESTRAGIAQVLLGRAGKELGTILDDTTGSLDDSIDRARRLGLILGDEVLDGAEEANDNLFLLGESLRTNFTRGISDAIAVLAGSGGIDNLIREVGEATRSFASAIVQLGQFITRYSPIIIGALTSMAAVSVVTGLANAATGVRSLATAFTVLNTALRLNPFVALFSAIAAIGSTVITFSFIGGGSDSEFSPSDEERIAAAGARAAEANAAAFARGEQVDSTFNVRQAAEEAEREAIRLERREEARRRNLANNQLPPQMTGGESIAADLQQSIQRQIEDRRRQFQRSQEDELLLLTESQQRRLEIRRQAEDLETEAERLRADAQGETAMQSIALAMELEGQAEQLRRSLPAIGSFGEAVSNTFDQLVPQLSQAVARGDFSSIGDIFVNTIQSAIQSRLAESLSTIFNDFFDLLFTALGFSVGGSNNTAEIGGRISSGQGAYLVGERGPELFVPETSGRVIPTNQTQALEGGGATFNLTIESTGDSSQDAVRMADEVQQIFRERGLLGA